MKSFALFFFLLILSASHSFAQNSAELKKKREKLTREIATLQRSLKQTTGAKKLTFKQISELNAKISLREEKIRVINSEVKALDNQISENTNTVHTLQGNLQQLKKEYAGMMRFAQHNKNSYSNLMYIFAADNFNQAYKRLKYLQQFSQYRKKQAGYIQSTQKQLNVKIVQLDKNKQEKNSLLDDQEKEKATLGEEKNNQTKVLAGLSKKEKQFKQEIDKKQQMALQLKNAIQTAIRREIENARKKAEKEERLAAAARAKAKAKTKSKVTAKTKIEAPAPSVKSANSSNVLRASPEAAALSDKFANNRGRLPWPVATSVVTRRYGDYKVGSAIIQNNGIEIKTSVGAAVRAVFDGTVSLIDYRLGVYTILIRHGEFFTIYNNLKSVSVSRGQKVSAKAAIGTTASSDEQDPTLHFELWKGKTPLDPSSWLAR